ncbi:unnamed protein product [Amoebophrya sp. A25]|nr:unnamed protein product [Amoebophrya sp. A25]|eukprot:GSA25T00027415001.1
MPFVCGVQVEHMLMVLKGLEGLSNTVVITVKEDEGMYGHAQDDSLVALCNWKLQYDSFPLFEFFKTHKQMISWKLDVRNLQKMLAGAERTGVVEIFSNDNPTFLGITYVNSKVARNEEFHAKLPLMKITDEDKSRIDCVPEEYYDNRATISSRTFCHIIQGMQGIGANIRFQLDAEHFRCTVENAETGFSLATSVGHRTDETNIARNSWVDLNGVKKSFDQRFPLKFLQIFTNCANQAVIAELYFAPNQPIIIRYLIGDSKKNGYVSFMTTPLLQADGQRDEDVAPGDEDI